MVWCRKGQAETFSAASGSAFLILIITVLIIIYILFLPPADREALLGNGPIPGSSPTVSGGYTSYLGTTVLREQIGRVDFVDEDEVVKSLSSFRIYSTTDASLIEEASSLYVKNSAFEKKSAEMTFEVNKRTTENVVLSFNVYRPDGILSVYANGERIFEGTLREGSPQPVRIPQSLLKDSNILYFEVSTPGFAFWRTNEYTLQNVRITGDITDNAHSFNRQVFFISENEHDALELASLEFFPDCTRSNSGNVRIYMNSKEVFYGLPDCGLKNFVTVSDEVVKSGENTLEFTSDSGSYIIDQVEVTLDLVKPDYPIYYFDLDEDLFIHVKDTNNFCGKVDGVCPDNCEGYEDKDCCFADSRNNYWCDIQTNNPRDRCVNQVLTSYTDRCPSGYEDANNNPPESAEGLCGDDTDDFCPAGCSIYHDRDCCFAGVNGAYWCDDVPLTGQVDICTVAVTNAMCTSCPNGYRDEDRDRPSCQVYDEVEYDDTPELKAGVDIILEITFATNDYKKVDLLINGATLPIDTYSLTVAKDISTYVREGINSVQVQPRRDVNIAELEVRIE